MSDWPLLSLVIFLPLAGAGFILLIRGEPEVVAQNARSVALWTASITFLLSLLIWGTFDPTRADFQLVEKVEWFAGFDINYHVGIDGISLFLVLLSTLITLVCVIVSWESIQVRVKEYMVAFLVMETFMVGVFCALDFVLFYLFFEGILIPMFLIIGIWGGPRRIYSAFKFFLYTLAGSVLFLVAILVMYLEAGTTDIPTMMAAGFDPMLQRWLWLAMFASFAVKVPMWPFHTWLPDAHVEAPTAGSVVLAGVLLKLGGYGYLRFSLPMLPDASQFFTPLIYALSIVAIDLHLAGRADADRHEEADRLLARSRTWASSRSASSPSTRSASRAASSRCSRTAWSRARSSCASAWSTTASTRARSRPTAGSPSACRPMPRSSCCSCWPRSACPAPRASSARSS